MKQVARPPLVIQTSRALHARVNLMAEDAGELMEVIRCLEDGGNPFAGDVPHTR